MASSSLQGSSGLGGSTLEYCEHGKRSDASFGSLPLGAIRNEHMFAQLQSDHAQYLAEGAAYCDERLQEVPAIPALYVTGGTAKALAKITGDNCVLVDQLKQLIDSIL